MKPPLVMLLSRDPYAEQSGRAFVLRQRIQQLSETHSPLLVIVAKARAAKRANSAELLPMASPLAVLMNAWRLRKKPLQTWLYYSPFVQARIRQIVRDARVRAVYVDMYRLAPLASGLPAHVAIITDYDDLLSMRYQRAAANSDGYEVLGFLSKTSPILASFARTFAGFLLQSEARRCAIYERDLLGHVDLALLTSPLEAELLRAKGHAARLVHPPPVLGAPPVVEPHEDFAQHPGRRIFFLGNLRYSENILMLNTLAQSLRDLEAEHRVPEDVVVEVIGEHAPELPGKFPRGRLQFLGRLPDLSVVAGQGIFLAPVSSGSGIKLKVLEGMALGCPVVTTRAGCDGLGVRPNRDLIVAEEPWAVLRTAVALRDRSHLKAMIVRHASAYLRRSHSDAVTKAVSAAVIAAESRAAERSCQQTNSRRS